MMATKQKKHRRLPRKQEVPTGGVQCGNCQVYMCQIETQCAKEEFWAMGRGEVYHCPDREPDWRERMCT